ncbi:CsgE family curli-type amyloid fiber assembly protein [Aequorivita echinoideorum]|uniref:Curli production assembly/transport component CsgE n=1 Tax=Aequorivita echinoideorum TaxID=1549647 RepID=A0ABS5S4Z1_9FLAO|nr:CsgE family curli-type amyloid fiber assembly protein [Aequorivita echinoideorum]MBT0608276.1 hypothetical protein [Aequorivita echinoideorum]
MVRQIKHNFVLTIFVLLFSFDSIAQFYNKEIEAKIDVENNIEFIQITGTALNKSEISESLRFELSVFRDSGNLNENITKDSQGGRIVIEPLEKLQLATTIINADDPDKVTVLLLIYDLDDNIKGKDRIVFKNGEVFIEAIPEKENIAEVDNSDDVDNKNKDGIILRGIVVEDTKTKPGRDFYNMFYSSYSLNNINGEKIIVIKEVLALGTNTKIEILIDDKSIFEFFARPNNEYLKSMSDFSIRKVYEYFQRQKKQKDIVRQY